jgi:RsiW-degrading membrane proteinase PrsW (M82 family)
MSGNDLDEGFLRQLPRKGVAGQQLSHCYTLSSTQEIVIGRDPNCDIVLDSVLYGMVSRHHAAIRPLPQQPVSWLLCDLNSVNGTFVNGQCLQGCQELQGGDRITLGHNGAEFIFECQNHQPTQLSSPPLISVAPESQNSSNLTLPPSEQAVSFSQLFPILSTGRDLTSKAYLIPGILTVIFVVLMFATVGQPEAANFNQILVATYLAGAAYYFVYQLCGKHKPWWVLLGTALTTVLILLGPILPLFIYIFRNLLPGRFPTAIESVSFPELLVRMFFGAGLMEELLKALPVLGAYFLGRQLHYPWRERLGVWEPLDGILLGTAAAVGFTLFETLGQYVPEMARNAALQTGQGAGQLVGLQLLIPRILGSVAGHMAYSGYLGYFIGLSVLKPRKRWQILGVGYFSAAALHALWNSTGLVSGLLLAGVGVLSYAFLTAAILKARALSPTRSQNFATRFLKRP